MNAVLSINVCRVFNPVRNYIERSIEAGHALPWRVSHLPTEYGVNAIGLVDSTGKPVFINQDIASARAYAKFINEEFA
ncbi:MAG: hypothetical protein KGI49_01385 [Patescibacteria group bacterium]|nr:hypothetical protein [Patescibacteria group bacterium]